MDKIFLTHEYVTNMISELIIQIESSGVVFDRIVGIARGGLNISIPISKYFNKPHEEITISYYHDGHDNTCCDEYAKVDLGDFDKTLGTFILVDDLIDSGATLKRFKKETKLIQGIDFYVATLHWNPTQREMQKPDFWVQDKVNQWIVFPWECENAKV
jgi:hypoxanthine phosphoribosyltransferase